MYTFFSDSLAGLFSLAVEVVDAVVEVVVVVVAGVVISSEPAEDEEGGSVVVGLDLLVCSSAGGGLEKADPAPGVMTRGLLEAWLGDATKRREKWGGQRRVF